MSGDLEDFLRRAAQRRQAKAAQQRGGPGGKPASGSRTRPQYSDSRTERLVRADEADEVLMAEIVEDEDESIAARMRRLEQAKREAAEAEAVLEQKKKNKSAAVGGRTSEPSEKLLTGNPADDLIRMLQQPGGIQRAILLKEILERPEDRW
jgi:hypothetical protein